MKRFDYQNPFNDVPLLRQMFAFHEAGHAIALVDFGISVKRMGLREHIRTSGEGGDTERGEEESVLLQRFDELNIIRMLAVVDLAGGSAQRHWQAETYSYGCESDNVNAAIRARSIAEITGQRFDDVRDEHQKAADELVKRRWLQLEKLANELYSRRELSGADVSALLLSK
jgi:hypothetical protein